MSDAQFAALIAALLGIAGTIAGAIRWAIGRVTKSIDGTHEVVRANTEAMIKNTASNAVLSTKVDAIAVYVERHTPFEVKKKARTVPHGIVVLPDPEDE